MNKSNITTAKWTENGAEQFHKYIVRGGGASETIIDTTCRNNRVLTINIDDPKITADKIKRRTQTEMRRRKETRITVSVPGWGLTDQEIRTNIGWETIRHEIFWIPNAVIPVSIPSLGVNTRLLSYEVEYEASPNSFGTTISLVNREAYL